MGKTKIVLSAYTLLIIFITTFVFHYSQPFYKLYAIADRLLKQSDYETALSYLLAAHNMKPDNIAIGRKLLWAYQQLGRNEEYIRTLEAIVQNRPDDKKFVLDLADALRYAGRNEEAVDVYEKYLGK